MFSGNLGIGVRNDDGSSEREKGPKGRELIWARSDLQGPIKTLGRVDQRPNFQFKFGAFVSLNVLQTRRTS